MKFKNLALGFLIEFIGIFLMLCFSTSESTAGDSLKWIGVLLMIGGPFLLWEVIPTWDNQKND